MIPIAMTGVLLVCSETKCDLLVNSIISTFDKEVLNFSNFWQKCIYVDIM